MLSLGPGSTCDICLEPFGADLKAPCSIPCGHVFCVNCLHQLARPSCPFCRTPFDSRQAIKLHVDLDSIKTPASFDGVPVPSNSDEGARHLQDKITHVAAAGATEIQTTQLTEECKTFLATVPKDMYSDLRTSYKMLYYMCRVKRLFVDQGGQVKALTQEVDRLKASIEALKLEKRNSIEALTLEKRDWEQAWQTVSDERDNLSLECDRLNEQLDKAEAEILLVTEQNETAQNQLVLLNEELQRLRSEGEFSSPEGDSPADIYDFSTDLPPSVSYVADDDDTHDPSAPFLTPWEEAEPKALPDADLPEDLEPAPSDYTQPNRAFCGAAGCPHSCDCMPFLLFSPGSREAAAAAAAAARNGDRAAGLTMSNGFGTMGSPSGLSLAMNHSRPRSRSRSHSRPRSRSLTRAPSPANQAPPNSSSASPLPSMSTSMTIPNPHHELRGQLHDLLRDPPMSSSLPNMTHSHFPSSPLSREFRHGAGSTTQPVSSRDRSVPITPSGKPRDNYLHPPMLSQSRIPSPFHTSTPLSDPASVQRPPLHRNTSNASQIDESQRSDRERQGADRAAARTPPRMVAETRLTPMLRPQSHNISIPLSSSATQAASPVHAMSRPQIPHKNSSLRLPTPPSSSDAMQRAQVHSTPLPSPSSNAPQQAAQPMPRAQAHAAPFSTTPPSGSNARPRTKPSSPSSSQPRTPPGPINSTAPASFPAGQSNRAANGAHSSRHAPEDTYTSTTTERVRRSDDARGGYGAGTRGTSKRMLAPAMAINPNMIST